MASPWPKCKERQTRRFSCQSRTRLKVGVFNSSVTFVRASVFSISWSASKENLKKNKKKTREHLRLVPRSYFIRFHMNISHVQQPIFNNMMHINKQQYLFTCFQV